MLTSITVHAHTPQLCFQNQSCITVGVVAGGDIRDIRRAVLDHPYDRDPPLTHRAARVWSELCKVKHHADMWQCIALTDMYLLTPLIHFDHIRCGS